MIANLGMKMIFSQCEGHVWHTSLRGLYFYFLIYVWHLMLPIHRNASGGDGGSDAPKEQFFDQKNYKILDSSN